jgi:hypothetical protein
MVSPIDAASIEFDKHRWYVVIKVTSPGGEVQEFVADSQIWSGDGVWFGTRAEHDEALADL